MKNYFTLRNTPTSRAGKKNSVIFIDANMDFNPIYRPQDSWITFLLVGLYLLLAFLRHKYPKRFTELLLLPINDKYFALEGRFPDVKHPFNGAFFVCQIAAFSLVIYLWRLQIHAGATDPPSTSYYNIVLIIACFLVLRYLLGFITSKALKLESILAAYRYERMSYHHIIALGLLLFITMLQFAPIDRDAFFYILPWLIIPTISFAAITSISRNSTYLIKNFFYFILYLCALELAPYILLFEVLRS